jgi:tRNA 2-selenouridine synthase SelU
MHLANYRFSGLDPNVDYELHAEHNESISATRTASSFNSSRDIEITLKLSHKKKS